jgi:mono/diheme cytochrome c family protein
MLTLSAVKRSISFEPCNFSEPELMSKMISKQAVVSCVAAGIGLVVVSLAAFAGVQSTKDGAFTAAQAERGKSVYDKSCVNCHQIDFYRERLPRFQGKPVGQLFEVVSTSMPADNIGALLTSEYIDVLAYIFSQTGSPPGNEELSTDNMDAISVGPAQ